MSRNNDSSSRTHPIVAQRITEQELPESGRVDKVKWNFIYEGDRGLALRLQEEEFSHHFNKNREERFVMRENLREAKVVQTEEEERLQIERMMELERMQEFAKRDEELARQLQQQEEQKTVNSGPDLERQLRADELLAGRLEEYEKARMKRYREYRRRQLEQEDLRRGISGVNLGGANNNTQPVPPETSLPVEEESFDIGFTDFLSQLPVGLSADEVKVIQELEDGGLAKLLQEAESKRSGAATVVERMKFIRRRAVELRDEQLAKLVQQREINRYNERRAKTMTSTSLFENNHAANGTNGNTYVPAPAVSAAQPPVNWPQPTAYTSVIRGPQVNEAYSNLSVTSSLPPPTQRPGPPTRPRQVSSAEATTSQRTFSSANTNTPQRNESYLGAVSRGPTVHTVPERAPPSSARPPVTVLDDYLTPNSLLTGTSSGNGVAKNNAVPPMTELTEYELPPEMNQPLESDQADATSRNRRPKIGAPGTVHPTNGNGSDRRSSLVAAPALPIVSPGAPPTATPPAHLQAAMNNMGGGGLHSSGGSSLGHLNNNGAGLDLAVPVVTNPMYIIERPTKSKAKNSDCKTQ